MSAAADRIATGLERVSDGINRVVWTGAAGFLVLMLALVVIQIIGRYGFSDAPAWTEEGARYAMVWSGLLGGVVAFHQNADPVLVQVTDRHPLWLRRLQVWSGTACIAIFLGVLLANSLGFVMRAAARDTESLGWNLGVVVAVLPLYAGLVLVQAVLKLAVFELRHAPGAATNRKG